MRSQFKLCLFKMWNASFMNVILLAQMVKHCIPISAIDWISLKPETTSGSIMIVCTLHDACCFFYCTRNQH